MLLENPSKPQVNWKKITLSLLLLAIIAIGFWTQSRLPALDTKAQMGQRNSISAIAFDIVLPVNPDHNLIQRASYSSINWAYTNWKGMTFGLLFAAAFLSLLKQLPQSKTRRHPIVSALQGTAMGVPLGVCANCATPIAQGMHKSGSRLETLLATLMSSPTLNIIVLGMMFALLPIHLVIIKIIAVLTFVLIVVPLLIELLKVKSAPTAENQLNKFGAASDIETQAACELEPAGPTKSDSGWFSAAKDTSRELLNNLLFIVKTTLPLMIVAGILGALLVEMVPFNALASQPVTFITLFLVALLGAFLPVPIAFDIIVVATLLASGLPIGLSMALLFSLGIFSIYPALIIARYISFRLSVALYVSCVLVAVITGYSAHYIDLYIGNKNTNLLNQSLSAFSPSKAAQNNLAVVRDLCLTHKDIGQQKACMYQSIRGFLTSQLNDSQCSNVLDDTTELADSCRLSIHHQSLGSNFKPCLDVQDANLRDHCLLMSAVDSKRSDSKTDLSSIGRENQPEYNNKEELCALIDSELLAIECNLLSVKPHTEMSDLQEADALAACRTSSEEDQRNHCLRGLYMRQAYFPYFDDDSQKTKSNICYLLRRDGLSTECYEYRAQKIYATNGSIENCRSITTTEIQSSCITAVLLRKLTLQLILRQQLVTEPATAKKNKPIRSTNNELDSQQQPAIVWSPIKSNDKNITLSYREDKPRSASAQNTKSPTATHTPFRQVLASEIGIDHDVTFSLSDFLEPFAYGRGITAGDYNNDGWPDLALSTAKGVSLYRNIGDGKFVAEPLNLSQLETSNSFVVSFMDVNNDGWLDLFISTYAGPNIIVRNDKGRWRTDTPMLMHDAQRIVSLAVGFADYDLDGDLDIYLGNWSYGIEKQFNPIFSANQWLRNNGDQFETTKANEVLGETLSVLFSDINSDRNIDLIVANDREAPDIFYLGGAEGQFSAVSGNAHIFAAASAQTMSLDTADFNNDLIFDLFSSDIGVGDGSQKPYCEHLKQDKQRCYDLLDNWQAARSLNATICNEIPSTYEQFDCLATIAIMLARKNEDIGLCELLAKHSAHQFRFCSRLAQADDKVPPYNLSASVPQIPGNKLLMGSTDGRWLDNTLVAGVDNSLWSWNAKAADLDNDEWQDIYVGNGFGFGETGTRIHTHSNVFYHNKGNGHFEKAEQKFGLVDYVNTPSYTYVDLDIDGDLDIVSTGTMSPPRIFINNNTNNSVSFGLRDGIGNRYCVGCRLIISYGKNGKQQQVRELKLSGGFLSFDEPVLHFGLGVYESIDRLEVIWSTGEKTTIDSPLPANRRYLITRIAEKQPLNQSN